MYDFDINAVIYMPRRRRGGEGERASAQVSAFSGEEAISFIGSDHCLLTEFGLTCEGWTRDGLPGIH